MICPTCHDEVLVTLEYHQLEVDYCPECNGIWLDSGEIELLFGDEQAAHDFLTIGKEAVVPRGEKPRRCPECSQKMTKESTESKNPITFDNCPQGDGMWLDQGELAIILAHADALVGNNDIANYLREVFPPDEDE